MSISPSSHDTCASPVLVGLLDSGIASGQLRYMAVGQDFSGATESNPEPQLKFAPIDRLGHGATLAQVIIDSGVAVALCVARIFDAQLTTSARQAAAGLDWLVENGARVVNLSFGLRQDRDPLAQACQRALEAGVVLIASSPAMGEPVYPASYPGVIRVTGDARCQPNEHSWAPSRQADFGACVRARHPRIIGASVACAYVSAQVAHYLQAHPDEPVQVPHLLDWLKQRARFQGVQRPFALIPWKNRLTWQESEL